MSEIALGHGQVKKFKVVVGLLGALKLAIAYFIIVILTTNNNKTDMWTECHTGTASA